MRFGFDLQRLTDTQLLAFLDAAHADSPTFWLAFLLGYTHAMRVTEILNLTRADVEGGFITVRGLKGSDTSVQPLLPDSNPLLNEEIAVPVFVRNLSLEQHLFPFSRFQMDRKFKKYGATAGLPLHLRHCHVLKHTCLSKLAPLVGIPVTKRWARHRSGASTLIYTDVDDQTAARAVRVALVPSI